MNIKNNKIKSSAKECAYLAVFVALLIAVQLALFAVPGVELVTVLFVAYAFAFGIRRGMIAATAFALLRQFVFGIYPNVLVLYLIYFNGLTALFGFLGKTTSPTRGLLWIVLCACVCTACFTVLDTGLTAVWYGYSSRVLALYFRASLSFMIPQIVCTAISVFFLFIPLAKVFSFIKRGLE